MGRRWGGGDGRASKERLVEELWTGVKYGVNNGVNNIIAGEGSIAIAGVSTLRQCLLPEAPEVGSQSTHLEQYVQCRLC